MSSDLDRAEDLVQEYIAPLLEKDTQALSVDQKGICDWLRKTRTAGAE